MPSCYYWHVNNHTNQSRPSLPSRLRLFLRALRYLGGKALTIAFTIFFGVFLTVLLANQPSNRGLGPPVSPFQTTMEEQVRIAVRQAISQGAIPIGPWGIPLDQKDVDELTERIREEAGLNLPYLPRNLLWTIQALTFDWGLLDLGFGKTGRAVDVILGHLPNTLLVIGAAYLLVFLIGLPLSLYLSQNYGKRLDRIFAVLAPVSSIPSWVIGILLIALFAFQLRLLPFGGKYDFNVPQDPVEHALVVAKHMILPVSAILLSLLFQVVYTWRTFFVIYSNEDYVELGRAKGLSRTALERGYILRPALPYVVTSFATTLINFWQLSMVQEAIFQWPGLGMLYINEALPDFFSESMSPGELIIVVGIVVVFAYLLGMLVFILDLVYVALDPRILLLPRDTVTQRTAHIATDGHWFARIQAWIKRISWKRQRLTRESEQRQRFSITRFSANVRDFRSDFLQKSHLFFHELRRYPLPSLG